MNNYRRRFNMDDADYGPRDAAWYRWLAFAVVISILVLAPLMFAGIASAQSAIGFCGFGKVQTPATGIIGSGAASETLVIGGTSTALTIPTITQGGPVIGAYIQVKNGTINYRVDGTAPTAATNDASDTFGPGGTTISDNAPFLVTCGSDMRNFQMIRAAGSATDSRVNVRYYIPGS